MDDWQQLLKRALGYLHDLELTSDDWRLGGGTLLMIRHDHRRSRDIDIFIHDVQYLSYLSPRLNDRTARGVKGYSEAANVLRLEYAEGEIDFTVAAPIFPGLADEPIVIDGISETIPCMPDVEILAQKLQYRAAGFTGRDLYDFVSVTRIVPSLLADQALHQIAFDKRHALKSSLASDACRIGFMAIDRPKFAIEFEEARSALLSWINDCRSSST